jgi:hypothetical protein
MLALFFLLRLIKSEFFFFYSCLISVYKTFRRLVYMLCIKIQAYYQTKREECAKQALVTYKLIKYGYKIPSAPPPLLFNQDNHKLKIASFYLAKRRVVIYSTYFIKKKVHCHFIGTGLNKVHFV